VNFPNFLESLLNLSKRNPLIALVIAVGVGGLIGAIASWEIADRTRIQPLRDQLSFSANDREILAQLKTEKEQLLREMATLQTQSDELKTQNANLQAELEEKATQTTPSSTLVVEETGNTQSSQVTEANITELASSPLQTIEAQGIIFNLSGCQFVAQQLECQLLITSKEIDQQVSICTRSNWGCDDSSVFDDQGNQYLTKQANLGNQSSGGYYLVRAELIGDVPTKALLTFESVLPSTKILPRFDLAFRKYSSSGYENHLVQFRNIALSQ
jgi:hypothetical protein